MDALDLKENRGVSPRGKTKSIKGHSPKEPKIKPKRHPTEPKRAPKRQKSNDRENLLSILKTKPKTKDPRQIHGQTHTKLERLPEEELPP